MKSHDKTHEYPAGCKPVPGEENVHGKTGMKQGTTKAVKANKAAEKKVAAAAPKRKGRGR
jgi:hypothetical protein